MGGTKQQRGMSRQVTQAWERERDAIAECERLRGLLVIAREGLKVAASNLAWHSTSAKDDAEFAYRYSDPDAEQVSGAD